MSNSDPNFDDPDFDAVDFINKQFPTEQSLATIDEHIANIREIIHQHDEAISQAVRNQTIVEKESRDELQNAALIIKELKQRIIDMKCQAKKSEQTVNEITCDIKQLDTAKRNVSASFTIITNLHYLVESVERLRTIYDKNEYRKIASVLAGIQDVMKQFDSFKHMPQIRNLSDEIDSLCASINERIDLDFKRVFEVPRAKNSMNDEDIKLTAEACLVVSLLGHDNRENLINWLLGLQLIEYNTIYIDSQPNMSSLDNVDKRYFWLKKNLLVFEEKYGFLFPPQWQMSKRMALEFCNKTKESLSRIMSANPNGVTLESLTSAMKKTTAFEKLLAKRFGDDEGGEKTISFDSIISSCFEPYSQVFIRAQEAAFQKLQEHFIDEHQKLAASPIKDQQSAIFKSSITLFEQFKGSLFQCIELSNKTLLLDLIEVFKRYLRGYAVEVLQIHLRGPSLSSSKTSSDAANIKMFSVAPYGAAGLLQSLLRNDTGRNKIAPNQVCSVILTAVCCLKTTIALESKLKKEIEESLVDRVDFRPAMDVFNELTDACIQLLIQHIEFNCEGGFITMVKTQWSSIETPVRQSQFVDDMINSLQTQIPLIRFHLEKAMVYFTQLCNKFITLFTHKYITNLFRCKLLSQGGAEQLLLDTQTLKKALIALPCHNLSDEITGPEDYIKAAEKGMSKAEMILKVVLVPHNSNFIESYFKLLPESNPVEFQRIMEMKGLKKSETNQLLEAYNRYLADNLNDKDVTS